MANRVDNKSQLQVKIMDYNNLLISYIWPEYDKCCEKDMHNALIRSNSVFRIDRVEYVQIIQEQCDQGQNF